MGVNVSREVRMRDLIRATENWSRLIDDMSIMRPTWFKNQYPITAADLGMGWTRTIYEFYNMPVDQSGLTNWKEAGAARAPGTNGPDDPGYDPCSTDADLVDFGMKAKTYTAIKRQLRTKDICPEEFMMDWEWEQQFQLYFDSLPQMGLDLWENLFMEWFMHLSNKYVMVGGNPRQVGFTYAPLTSNNITVTAAPANVSTFNWGPMPYFLEWLTAERADSATAMIDGAPAWNLIMDPDDFMGYIDRNAKVSANMQFARPNVMLENWAQSVPVYRGFPRISKKLMPRFRRTAAGTYERVDPFSASSTGMSFGNKYALSDAYLNAEYSVFFIQPKDAFSAEVPPLVTSIAGAQNKAMASYGGDFRVICNPDNDTNELGEKFKFFLRILAFMRPGKFSSYPITVLYRRCVGETLSLCDGTVEEGSGAVAISAGTAVNDTVAGSALFYVTLASRLPCESGPVTITGASGTTYSGYIGASSDAPNYWIIGDADRDWATLLATGTIACATGAV